MYYEECIIEYSIMSATILIVCITAAIKSLECLDEREKSGIFSLSFVVAVGMFSGIGIIMLYQDIWLNVLLEQQILVYGSFLMLAVLISVVTIAVVKAVSLKFEK